MSAAVMSAAVATATAAAAITGAGPSGAGAIFPPGLRRVVLAGHPRAGQGEVPQAVAAAIAHQPKEILLALAAACAAAAGLPAQRANPHFLPVAEWSPALAVMHFDRLDQLCPVPLAQVTLLLDGEDLLILAEERRSEDQAGLQRQRCLLMDRILSVAPAAADAAAAPLLPEGGRVEPAPLGALLSGAPALPTQEGAAAPVQWLACDLETGPYNFLQVRRDQTLGTSHVRVLMGQAARAGRPSLLAFATPRSLGELGPALRAFAALARPAEGRRGGGGGPSALLHLMFFGGPEAFRQALAEQPNATFFNDNFRCPAIRVLFAPFAAAEALAAIRGASLCLDTAYGGLLDGLARALGVANRVVLGPDGRFDAWAGGRELAREVAWDEVLSPGTLARRRQKADRSRERMLADVMEAMLAAADPAAR
jgi:hypothetical protein